MLLASIALSTFPLLAEAGAGTAESAWDVMVRTRPETVDDRSVSSLDRKVLQVLTPEQAARLDEGAEPASIDLPNGETLAEFIDRVRRSAASGLVFQPLDPCRLLDTRSAGGKLAAEETRALQVRDPGPEDAHLKSAAAGCGVDGAHRHTILPDGGTEARPINMSVVWIIRVE